MIDIQTERLIPLAEAAAQIPGRRPGKPVGVATIYRWVDIGVRGIRLESISAGGTLCTTSEAVRRFFERVTEARQAGRSAGTGETPERTAGERQRASEAAAKRLDAMMQAKPRRTRRKATADVS